MRHDLLKLVFLFYLFQFLCRKDTQTACASLKTHYFTQYLILIKRLFCIVGERILGPVSSKHLGFCPECVA